ncbi:MAG: VOC family protein [Lysobacterales bacterium]
MIGYVTLGTNDMKRAVTFYDALVDAMGGKRFMEHEDTFVAWCVDPMKPGVAVTKPFDGQAASSGNGVMVALMVDSTEQVDALYEKAIELGATDEGQPGPRGEGFYAGYFRDLDGHKLNFFCSPQ